MMDGSFEGGPELCASGLMTRVQDRYYGYSCVEGIIEQAAGRHR